VEIKEETFEKKTETWFNFDKDITSYLPIGVSYEEELYKTDHKDIQYLLGLGVNKYQLVTTYSNCNGSSHCIIETGQK
jgi:hypothetical protein